MVAWILQLRSQNTNNYTLHNDCTCCSESAASSLGLLHQPWRHAQWVWLRLCWASQLWPSWSQAAPDAACVLQWHSLLLPSAPQQRAAFTAAFALLWVVLHCWHLVLQSSGVQRARKSWLNRFHALRTSLTLQSSPCLRATLVDTCPSPPASAMLSLGLQRTRLSLRCPQVVTASWTRGRTCATSGRRSSALLWASSCGRWRLRTTRSTAWRRMARWSSCIRLMVCSLRRWTRAACKWTADPSPLGAILSHLSSSGPSTTRGPTNLGCILKCFLESVHIFAYLVVFGLLFGACEFVADGVGRALLVHACSKEADPLTTLFIKARVMAFQDIPNLFALPQPNMDELVPVGEPAKEYTEQEYTTKLMEAWGTLG